MLERKSQKFHRHSKKFEINGNKVQNGEHFSKFDFQKLSSQSIFESDIKNDHHQYLIGENFIDDRRSIQNDGGDLINIEFIDPSTKETSQITFDNRKSLSKVKKIMKKPFSALKIAKLTGVFGHFRPCPDDKVRLLSVLSHKIDDDREDEENFGSEDDDQNPDNLSILSDDVIDQGNSSSSSVSTTSLKNMAPNKNNRLIDLEVNRNNLNKIKSASIQNDLKISGDQLVRGDQRKNDELSRHRQATNIRRMVDQNRSIEIDKKKCNDEELKSAQEWIFTLYDFDAKGRVTKGDIISLVRSIYDVLTNAEIPILKSSPNDKPPARQPMGAFRVKLAIISRDNQVTDQKDVKLMNVDKRNASEEPESSTSSSSSAVEKCRRWTTDSAEIYEQMPLIDGKVKKQNIRHTLQDQKENVEPVFLRKTTKINFTPRPKSYIHRDYVNLSELEACCHKNHSSKNPPHFWTPCLNQNNGNENNQCKNEMTTADNVVHHIRHCDQHCHCPVDKKRSILTEKAFPCYHGKNTHFEERYIPYLFAKHSNRHASQLQSKIRAYYDRTHNAASPKDADRHRRRQSSEAAATCESPCRPGPDYCRRQRTTTNVGEDVDCGLNFYHCDDDAKLREKRKLRRERVKEWMFKDQKNKRHSSYDMENSGRFDCRSGDLKNDHENVIQYHEHHHYYHF